jgi:glutaredoxin
VSAPGGRRLRAALAILLVAACLAPACKSKQDDGTAPRSTDAALPPLDLRDDTANLMLTWIDEKGETHVELHPSDVPAEGKSLVRAVLSDRQDGTRDLFYVVDLTQKGENGSYAVRTVSRREWESTIEKRRAEYIAKTAPPPPASSSAAGPGGAPAQGPSSDVTVVIYGASWCGPCHQAADYLRKKGVRTIVKDIEADPGAAEEMQAKLEQSHQRGGSIPIIDVRGQILVGFSARALDQALTRAGNGTTL